MRMTPSPVSVLLAGCVVATSAFSLGARATPRPSIALVRTAAPIASEGDLLAPGPLRALVPAVAGLGGTVFALRQVAVSTRKQREEREAREARERAEARALGIRNAATVGVLPAAAVAATVFLGPIIAPPDDGSITSSDELQKAAAASCGGGECGQRGSASSSSEA